MEKEGTQRKIEQLENKWLEVWEPSGIIPRTPKEMRAWVDRYREIAAQISELRKMLATIENHEKQINRHCTKISKALTNLGEAEAKKTKP